MTFIRSFSIDTDKQHPFPFNIPAIKFARRVALNEQVTIFVGDNGTGKSTLLESIACRLNVPLIGGYMGESKSFAAAKILKPWLAIDWRRETAKGFFFRAEDSLKQLSLIAFILEVLKKGNAQFIIATHSPILMGIPDATIYQIVDEGMEPVTYKETDHYQITRRFLNEPESYLRHLR